MRGDQPVATTSTPESKDMSEMDPSDNRRMGAESTTRSAGDAVLTLRSDDRWRWIALVALCAGFLMIILDQTIVNVALPSIQSDLHFSQSSLAWVVNAYLIAFGGLLLLVGRLGDLIGRRRIFLAGLALFTTASMLCGLAQSQGLLIGARFVQGIGGAMTSAVILGMIVTMFPKPAEQAKAIAVYSFRCGGRRSPRSATRRVHHPEHQLALDLLRQPADRHRDRSVGDPAAARRSRSRARAGR
jgi:cyanate permease